MLKLTITHAGDPIPPLTDAELATIRSAIPEIDQAIRDMEADYARGAAFYRDALSARRRGAVWATRPATCDSEPRTHTMLR